MNNFSITGASQASYVECEEYFPLRVIFDPSIGENHIVGFYGGEDNLLEFTVNSNTNIITKFQIVTCKNFDIIGSNLDLPDYEMSGSIHLDAPQHNNCDTFTMSVYADSIMIKLSANTTRRYYAMGQVLFGISDDNEIVTLIITELSAREIAHSIFELQADQTD